MATKLLIHTHLSPRIVEVRPPTTEVTVQELYDDLQDLFEEPAFHSFDPIVVGEGKADLGGGTTVDITATLQNARLMFTGRTTPLEANGTCTSDEPRGLTLHATGGDFVNNEVYPGCTVLNMTTMSMASVVEVVSGQELRHFKLSGGTRDTWEIGDSYFVYPNEQCSISGGNLVAVDENFDTIPVIYQSPNVQVVRSSSSSGTLQQQATLEHSSFGDVVMVDVTSEWSGTAFPVGTGLKPVNNMVDALAIALERGFRTFRIRGDIVLTDQDYSKGYAFYGDSPHQTTITIESGANVEECEFHCAHVTGTLDGNNTLCLCSVGDLNYLNGLITQCGLIGTVVLGGGVMASFIDCYSNVPGTDTPIIDMGGSGQALSIRNYNGGIKLTNKSGSDSVSLDINSGTVELDTTVTAGTVVVRGVGVLEDNSTGTTNVVNDGMVPQKIIEEIGSRIVLLTADITRLLGLSHENSFLDNTEYDINNQLVSGRLRIFNSKANAEAATDGGSETTGLVATYIIEAEYEALGKLKSYRMVHDS